jgi:hypothetical protein
MPIIQVNIAGFFLFGCFKKISLRTSLVTLAFGRMRQEDQEFKGSLGYIARPCLPKAKQQQQHKKSLFRIYLIL